MQENWREVEGLKTKRLGSGVVTGSAAAAVEGLVEEEVVGSAVEPEEE